MRSLRSHPGYEVTFTLLNPQPGVLDVTWDITDAIDGMSCNYRLSWHSSHNDELA